MARSRDPGNSEINYRCSTDRGSTWSPEENVSRSDGFSSTTLLASTAHYRHIIWLYDRIGRFQV
jgi:hypothetical protein